MLNNLRAPYYLRRVNSPYWLAMRTYLRLRLMTGSVLVVMGPVGSGARDLMEKLTPQRVVDNSNRLFSTGADRFIPSVGKKYPGLEQSKLPAASFAIDNAAFHDLRDLTGIVLKETRGFILGFQSAKQITDSDLRRALSHRKVVTLELIESSAVVSPAGSN
jgi:hypothetical protein